jgi:hypothetical protein
VRTRKTVKYMFVFLRREPNKKKKKTIEILCPLKSMHICVVVKRKKEREKK